MLALLVSRTGSRFVSALGTVLPLLAARLIVA
jgi:hypothetical protein